MSGGPAGEAVALLRHSPLKRAKYRALQRMMGDVRGRRCLDVGGDNGVISWLLRTTGGTWTSVDADAVAVAAIRRLVGPQVTFVDGPRLPFAAASFDLVAIVDYLEHVRNDSELIQEVARILRPGGRVVINVPHRKNRSLLRLLRERVGLTDAWHGHVRPGYTLPELHRLMEPVFEIEASATYTRAFSEVLDVALNAFQFRVARHQPTVRKGPILRTEDVASSRLGPVLTLGGPLLRAFAALDALLFLQPGYRLIVRARRGRRAE